MPRQDLRSMVKLPNRPPAAGFVEEKPARGATLEHMALFRIRSAAVYGIKAHPIDVEVDLYPSGSARDFITVGMPATVRIR